MLGGWTASPSFPSHCRGCARCGTTTSLHTGVKDHYGVGRIEHGDTEWWGGGKVWRSAPGSILVKQPGDVVRHLAHRGPTTYTAVMLPTRRRRSGPAARRWRSRSSTPTTSAPRRFTASSMRCARELTASRSRSRSRKPSARLPSSATRKPDYSRPVRRALEYLRERLGDSITLDHLADYADLDKFHLCRAFRAQIGMPPHAYLTHLRISRAKELLHRGERATDVAPQVGFYDQAQLTRHFRRLRRYDASALRKVSARLSRFTSTTASAAVEAEAVEA